MSQPARVELTIYDVLPAAGDPRSEPALEVAYARLQARAAKIGEQTLRHSFLEGTVSRAACARCGPASRRRGCLARRPPGPDPAISHAAICGPRL